MKKTFLNESRWHINSFRRTNPLRMQSILAVVVVVAAIFFCVIEKHLHVHRSCGNCNCSNSPMVLISFLSFHLRLNVLMFICLLAQSLAFFQSFHFACNYTLVRRFCMHLCDIIIWLMYGCVCVCIFFVLFLLFVYFCRCLELKRKESLKQDIGGRQNVFCATTATATTTLTTMNYLYKIHTHHCDECIFTVARNQLITFWILMPGVFLKSLIASRHRHRRRQFSCCSHIYMHNSNILNRTE